jgi:glycosyltransferase involved in cell wall biosynthesis
MNAVMANAPSPRLHVVFDVSDVINYFRYGRLPTGIQRVQIELVEYALRAKGRDFDFSIACFTKEANYWIEITKSLFGELSRLSVGPGEEESWDDLVERLETSIQRAKHFVFPDGAVLLNLGSSWWLQNYFLGVRYAKSRYNVRYVPFIHDFIPMVMPELCTDDLRTSFIEWIDSVFDHADHFLVNSQSTLKDLNTASKLAAVERDAAVITLDADFRNAPTRPAERLAPAEAEAGLVGYGLKSGGYVLFVSTIEPRKNHAMVFSTWLRLIEKYGPEKCPKLVCVGQRGWLNDEAYAKLAASPALMRQVSILSGVTDAMLGALYENCICTLYPSLYEGWGLPVTESLCFGKVPVISKAASMPEAGGPFAEYFDLRSDRDFQEAVERLVFDDTYRKSRERKIAAEFHPRSWPSIGGQIIGQLQDWVAKPAPPRARRHMGGETRTGLQSWQKIGAKIAGQLKALVAPVLGAPEPPVLIPGIYPVHAQTGIFYSLAGEIEGARGKDAKRGEVYRNSADWWWPEPWGSWVKGRGPAQVAFVLNEAKGVRYLVYAGLRGIQGQAGTATVQASSGNRLSAALAADEERIVTLTLDAVQTAERQVVLSFTSDETADFRVSTLGTDFRICGVGVKWFYVCREDDMQARLDLIEMLQMEEAVWFRASALRAS